MSHYFYSAISTFLKVTLVLSLCAFAHAADYISVPTLQGRVTDLANVLSIQDRERLSKMLAAYEQETQHQLAVLIVPTLSGEAIESFSLRVANTWKLGHKGVNNGILVTLAISDRKTRIELGLGMEPYISNATAASIISRSMIPAFRRGDYAEGLDAGLIELMKEGRKFVVPVSKTNTSQKHDD
jgi:uncharacterized protein